MLSLVYASSAIKLLSDEALAEILRVSRTNNAQLDITGLLLYKDGNFIQVLEGPDENVRAVYQKIQRDPLHKSLMLLLEEPITERLFPDWSMGFQRVEHQTLDLPGFSPFLADDSLVDLFRQNRQRVARLLLAFRENIR